MRFCSHHRIHLGGSDDLLVSVQYGMSNYLVWVSWFTGPTYISNDLGWVSWIPGPTHISNYFVWVSWIPGPTHISCTISHYPFATIIICLFLSSRSFYFITHFVRLIQKSCTTNPATRVRDPIQFQFPLISFESATQSLPYPMSSYHEFLRLFVQFNSPVTNKSCHSGL